MKSALALAAITFLTTLPAHATSCSWSAKMEEDEGGSVMTASVCGGPKGDAHLMLACFDKPVLSYDLGAAGATVADSSADWYDDSRLMIAPTACRATRVASTCAPRG